MRIVGGMWRGRAFDAPEGRGTRPTTDRMRESIASMVLSAQDLDLSGCAVLDAFAGSGGVGLELLSRGARSCTFCEQDRRAAAVLRSNCKSLAGNDADWNVVSGDVRKRASSGGIVGGPFSIVFLDPPYAMPASEVSAFVESLYVGGALSDDCLVVYERASEKPTLEVRGALPLRSRAHGGTCIDLFRMEGSS